MSNTAEQLFQKFSQTVSTEGLKDHVRLTLPLQALAMTGAIDGVGAVHKFGKTFTATAAYTDVWVTGGVYAWPQAAVTMEAISASGNDTAAGSGAQKIIIQGLDSDFNPVSEEITMNGLGATTATTQTFRRVNRAYVSESGTYGSTTAGSNAGIITVRISGAGATQLKINFADSVGVGQTQVARYTVPAGYKAVLCNIDFKVSGTKTAHGSLFQRQNADDITTPFTGARRLVYGTDDFVGADPTPIPSNVIFPEKTDIWATVHAASVAGTTEFSCSFDLILLKVS